MRFAFFNAVLLFCILVAVVAAGPTIAFAADPKARPVDPRERSLKSIVDSVLESHAVALELQSRVKCHRTGFSENKALSTAQMGWKYSVSQSNLWRKALDELGTSAKTYSSFIDTFDKTFPGRDSQGNPIVDVSRLTPKLLQDLSVQAEWLRQNVAKATNSWNEFERATDSIYAPAEGGQCQSIEGTAVKVGNLPAIQTALSAAEAAIKDEEVTAVKKRQHGRLDAGLIRMANNAMEAWDKRKESEKDRDAGIELGPWLIEAEIAMRGKPFTSEEKLKLRAEWRATVEKARAAVKKGATAEENIWDVIEALFPGKLENYDPDQGLLTEFLLTGKGNCEARSKLILATLDLLKLSPSRPSAIYLQTYDNHAQAVVYNAVKNEIWDLVYGDRYAGPPDGPLYHPLLLAHGMVVGGDANPSIGAGRLLRVKGEKGIDFSGKGTRGPQVLMTVSSSGESDAPTNSVSVYPATGVLNQGPTDPRKEPAPSKRQEDRRAFQKAQKQIEESTGIGAKLAGGLERLVNVVGSSSAEPPKRDLILIDTGLGCGGWNGEIRSVALVSPDEKPMPEKPIAVWPTMYPPSRPLSRGPSPESTLLFHDKVTLQRFLLQNTPEKRIAFLNDIWVEDELEKLRKGEMANPANLWALENPQKADAQALFQAIIVCGNWIPFSDIHQCTHLLDDKQLGGNLRSASSREEILRRLQVSPEVQRIQRAIERFFDYSQNHTKEFAQKFLGLPLEQLRVTDFVVQTAACSEKRKKISDNTEWPGEAPALALTRLAAESDPSKSFEPYNSEYHSGPAAVSVPQISFKVTSASAPNVVLGESKPLGALPVAPPATKNSDLKFEPEDKFQTGSSDKKKQSVFPFEGYVLLHHVLPCKEAKKFHKLWAETLLSCLAKGEKWNAPSSDKCKRAYWVMIDRWQNMYPHNVFGLSACNTEHEMHKNDVLYSKELSAPYLKLMAQALYAWGNAKGLGPSPKVPDDFCSDIKALPKLLGKPQHKVPPCSVDGPSPTPSPTPTDGFFRPPISGGFGMETGNRSPGR